MENEKTLSRHSGVNYSKGERITVICLVGNIVLCVVKFIAGIIGNSQAMVADALHSSSDVVATLAVFFGIKIAQKPENDKYHYGYGKIEPIISTFVGLSLVLAAFMIARGIFYSVTENTLETPKMVALIAAIISITVKEWMYIVTYKIGVEINSESIKANALDHRSDAFSSVGTLIGIGGSIIGGVTGIEMLRYLDPLAGMIVACIIFRMAIMILAEAMRSLMDAAPEKETIQEIINVASTLPDVCEVNWVMARYSGPTILGEIAIVFPGI
jgi:cation diffusion facilitator family transporter